MPSHVKDPDATLDYVLDWSGYLTVGETITTSTWMGDGLTINSTSNTGTTTTVWVTGGTLGTRHRLTNRVTTSGGRTDDRTIPVYVDHR